MELVAGTGSAAPASIVATVHQAQTILKFMFPT